ncbi:MAG: hypothetical protein ACXWZS_06620 [Gemmatirosa sp.]
MTPRLRLHRDEVLAVLLKGNTVVLRFVAMKPMRIPVDDLTDEAREWLLPSLAPRDIPQPGDCDCHAEEAEEADQEVERDAERR